MERLIPIDVVLLTNEETVPYHRRLASGDKRVPGPEVSEIIFTAANVMARSEGHAKELGKALAVQNGIDVEVVTRATVLVRPFHD